MEPSEKPMNPILVILNLIQNPRIDGLFKPWIPDQVRNDGGFSEGSMTIPIMFQFHSGMPLVTGEPLCGDFIVCRSNGALPLFVV